MRSPGRWRGLPWLRHHQNRNPPTRQARCRQGLAGGTLRGERVETSTPPPPPPPPTTTTTTTTVPPAMLPLPTPSHSSTRFPPPLCPFNTPPPPSHPLPSGEITNTGPLPRIIICTPTTPAVPISPRGA